MTLTIDSRNDETRGSLGCDAGYKKLWIALPEVQAKVNPCRAKRIQQRQQAIPSIVEIVDRIGRDCNQVAILGS
jgi:hypothetical protein